MHIYMSAQKNWKMHLGEADIVKIMSGKGIEKIFSFQFSRIYFQDKENGVAEQT